MQHNVEVYHLAEVQLLKAIELYKDGEFICAITLAGAAEEILGKLIKHCKGDDHNHIVDEMISRVEQEHESSIPKKEVIKMLNNARDRLKHFDPNREIEFKPVDDAVAMIVRACINYAYLRGVFISEMKDFLESNQTRDVLEKLSA